MNVDLVAVADTQTLNQWHTTLADKNFSYKQFAFLSYTLLHVILSSVCDSGGEMSGKLRNGETEEWENIGMEKHRNRETSEWKNFEVEKTKEWRN